MRVTGGHSSCGPFHEQCRVHVQDTPQQVSVYLPWGQLLLTTTEAQQGGPVLKALTTRVASGPAHMNQLERHR